MDDRNALIAVNYIGFLHFLWEDIDILQNMGYKVHVAADNVKKEDYTLDILAKKKVVFYEIPLDSKSTLSKKNLRAFFTYKRIIEKECFDFIHCHTPVVGALVRLAAWKRRKFHGMKVIYTTHGLPYTKYSSKKEYFKFHTIESIASRFCDAIITINLEDYEQVKQLHCPQCYHINGVGLNERKFENCIIDRKEYRERCGIPENKIMILSIGELSARKNHIAIIKALSLLYDRNNYVYCVCGRAMDNNKILLDMESEAKKNNVDFKYMGYRKDIAQLIQCSDIGAIPSVREGLGMAGLESLYLGVPLIGTDVQGIREYILDGKTGFLAEPFNYQRISENILKLSDKSLREKMKFHCVEIVKKFTKNISVSQRMEIYKEILK